MEKKEIQHTDHRGEESKNWKEAEDYERFAEWLVRNYWPDYASLGFIKQWCPKGHEGPPFYSAAQLYKNVYSKQRSTTPESREESEKELWDEIGLFIHGGSSFEWYPEKLKHLMENYSIKRNPTKE